MSPTDPALNTLEPALALLLEHLPRAVVPEIARAPIWACAHILPPIPQGYFEVRLDGTSDQVDFHQVYKLADRARALAYLQGQSAPPFDHPIWRRTSDLIAAWNHDDSLRDAIDSMYLEFDGVATHSAAVLPSLFIGFAVQRWTTGYDWALAVLTRLYGADFRPTPALQGCFDVEYPAWISHIGVLLPRPNAPIRVNLRVPAWDAVLPWLERIGWRGDADGTARLIAWLGQHADHFTLAVDVSATVQPRIGFELFTQSPGSLLDALVERGHCTPAARAALPTEPILITPTNTQTAWADHLIVEAISDPAQRLSALVIQPSHIKVTAYPDGRIQTKSYLAFDPYEFT